MSALYPHQVEALQALNTFYAKGGRSGGISLPTGTGKTRVMTAQADQESRDDSDPRRVAIIVDRDVLVEQTEKTLRKFLPPGISIGVIKARRNELGARVLVISVHTMKSQKRIDQLPPIKLAIVDEAHMSVSPTYKRLFAHLGANQPGGARLAGYSATWSRSDGTGLGDIWQEVVYAKSIRWAISNGYLVKPNAIQLGEGVDLSEVRTLGKNGDYRESDLGKAVMLEELRDTVVAGVLKHGIDPNGLPRRGVLFAPTVESAEYFGDGLRDAGIPTEGIYGTLSGGERRARHGRHDSGETEILTTCTALAVGWDFPPAWLGVLLRPVRHEGLFVQMAGRLLRTSRGKTRALLLDCVRATDDVRLRNSIDLSKTVHRDVGELEEVPPTEPVVRERIVHRRKGSYEVEIVAGASVPWYEGPSGIPFTMIGADGLVFVVEDIGGYHVGWYQGRHDAIGEPLGRFVESGLDRDTAIEVASEFAEGLIHGGSFSHSGSRWRSDASREMDRRRVLGYFARWSEARLNATLVAAQ